MLAEGRRVYYLNPKTMNLVDLAKVMDGRLLAEYGEAPPAPEAAEGGKTRKSRAAKVDTGKIRALHEAGWSAAEIADEMGVASATIYYHLKKMAGREE